MQAEHGVGMADSGWKARMKHRNTSSQKYADIALLGFLPKTPEISQLPGHVDLEIS